MPNTVEYETSDDLSRRLTSILAFPEFADFEQMSVPVKSCLKMTMTEEGEVVECKGAKVDLKKVPGAFEPFVDAKFVLVIDAYTWGNRDARYVDGLIHHALMKVKLKVNDSGKVTSSKRQFDVVEFYETVNRYGLWNEGVSGLARYMTQVGTAAGTSTAEVVDRQIRLRQPVRSGRPEAQVGPGEER